MDSIIGPNYNQMMLVAFKSMVYYLAPIIGEIIGSNCNNDPTWHQKLDLTWL